MKTKKWSRQKVDKEDTCIKFNKDMKNSKTSNTEVVSGKTVVAGVDPGEGSGDIAGEGKREGRFVGQEIRMLVGAGVGGGLGKEEGAAEGNGDGSVVGDIDGMIVGDVGANVYDTGFCAGQGEDEDGRELGAGGKGTMVGTLEGVYIGKINIKNQVSIDILLGRRRRRKVSFSNALIENKKMVATEGR